MTLQKPFSFLGRPFFLHSNQIQNPELLEDVLPGSFLGTEGVEKWEVQLFFWSWMCGEYMTMED